MNTVKLDDGKYAINMDDNTGAMTFFRNGEAWPGGQEAFQHAKLVSSMAYRILELEASNAGLVEALKELTMTDGSSANVSNTEVLAARIRGYAGSALTAAGVK